MRINSIFAAKLVATVMSTASSSALAAEPLFDNGNVYAVANHPSSAPMIRLDGRTRITTITTYHWNNGRGAAPGSITMLDNKGLIYGPWPASGSEGQGGVPNAYWTVHPNVTLPAGRYTLLDSDIATWAHNEGSGGVGMVRVEGRHR